MTADNATPEALLSHLPKSDGSATYSHAGYTVIGAVNGPIEVQRRDELPDEAVVDVVVRPAAGVGGTRERHLESLLQSTLRRLILVNNFPRTLIQIILQVTVTPENEYSNSKLVQASTNLPMLPALLQTAVLSLLSAALPLTYSLTACGVAVMQQGEEQAFVIDPSPRELETCQSFHVVAFTAHHELLLAESEGVFDLEQWELVYDTARRHCCAPEKSAADGDVDMDGSEQSATLNGFIRSTMESKITADLHWK